MQHWLARKKNQTAESQFNDNQLFRFSYYYSLYLLICLTHKQRSLLPVFLVCIYRDVTSDQQGHRELQTAAAAAAAYNQSCLSWLEYKNELTSWSADTARALDKRDDSFSRWLLYIIIVGYTFSVWLLGGRQFLTHPADVSNYTSTCNTVERRRRSSMYIDTHKALTNERALSSPAAMHTSISVFLETALLIDFGQNIWLNSCCCPPPLLRVIFRVVGVVHGSQLRKANWDSCLSPSRWTRKRAPGYTQEEKDVEYIRNL